jgi:hypothetical protein
MLNKDRFLTGMFLGLVPPGIAAFFVEILGYDGEILGKKHLLYIASVVINLLLLRFFFRSDRSEIARGIIFSTFISALLFVILNRIS